MIAGTSVPRTRDSGPMLWAIARVTYVMTSTKTRSKYSSSGARVLG